ncbi:O-antigen ligase family protein [Schumannella sp. 10F1B-5-1]|uniref:O-antigen ligase family protein n=1 Tax=Schumannella sp. 10F1B-5-1 TaxID=2590780 RepID=UPI001130C077|nr:O-antigen ligase family protein [Schumannella sp. 10F1B-5-1]TPW73565.1 exopolysaccharide production protein [Schumannella sp. 10F1B-5-1]
MTGARDRAAARGRGVLELIAHPRTSQALAVVIAATSLSSAFLRALLGWGGFLAALIAMAALAGVSLWAQRDRIEWRGVLPISVLAFFAWMLVSVFFSQYGWISAGAALYAVLFGLLGTWLALARDLIQVIRAFGDALRAILAVGLVLEVLSGIILDVPLHLIGITGSIANGGPIQGIAGTRNYLGYLACLAVITFLTEWRTRSVERPRALFSLALVAVTLLFARSPVTFVVLVVIGVAAVAVYALRRVPARRRPIAQFVVAGIVVAGAVAAWMLRRPIIDLLNAASDFDSRSGQWSRVLQLSQLHQLEGWGWVGIWRPEVFPYSFLSQGDDGKSFDSALNAALDAYFQLGIIGVILLGAAFALAMTRAWLVGTENPNTTYAWPALVLVLLAATSLAESYLLFEGGLLLFVTCALAAARKRSWRHRLSSPVGTGREDAPRAD